ncbi:hypothetical protein ACFVGN_43750, partial [Streptomyces sp. NPDC057757]
DAFPEASPAEHLAALLKDDPTSAGQVGTALTERQFDQLLASGNLREVMTAFFNGVFFKDSPMNLKSLLNTIVEHKQWDRAGALGLNVAELKKQAEFLDGPLRPGEIGPDQPLSWRTGEAVHRLNQDTAWYRSVNGEQGMRVVAGVSATAAKMMTAFKLLGIDASHADDMVKALFGWMLPVSDHSVYEILKGVDAVGATLPLNPKALKSAEGMYRNLPGIPLKEVRRLLGDAENMLPHEQVYAAKVRATLPGGGFGEPGVFHVNTLDERRRIFELLAEGKEPSGYDRDDVARVRKWLDVNGRTPAEVLESLTPAHFYAVAAYTGPAFPLINVMMRPGGSLDRVLLIQIEHVLRGTELPQSRGGRPARPDPVGGAGLGSLAHPAAPPNHDEGRVGA